MSGWAALIIALSAFVPAMVGAVISLLAYWESRHNTKQLIETTEKLTVAQKGVDQVHEIVNSQKTAMLAEIAGLKDHVERMYGKLADKQRQIDHPLI